MIACNGNSVDHTFIYDEHILNKSIETFKTKNIDIQVDGNQITFSTESRKEVKKIVNDLINTESEKVIIGDLKRAKEFEKLLKEEQLNYRLYTYGLNSHFIFNSGYDAEFQRKVMSLLRKTLNN